MIQEWLRARPFVVDTLLVLPLLLVPILGVVLAWGRNEAPEPLTVVDVVLLLPLIWRRRFPTAVFAVVSVICAFQAAVIQVPLFGDLGFLVALYSVSAYTTRRWVRPLSLVVGMIGALLAPVMWAGPRGTSVLYVWREIPGQAALLTGIVAALCAFVWTLGGLLRTRRAYVRQLEERARHLEYERDQQDRIARSAERARIAGELHDVVAHSLSVVVAQSDGGRYAADHDPEAARRALTTIGTTSRQALTEMRRLLGVLRTEEAEPVAGGDAIETSPQEDVPAPAPQPGIGELEDLIQRVRDCGLAVELALGVDPAQLPSGLGLVAYRVVQEALTNVLKHGGSATRARARLAVDHGVLEVEVVDDGDGAAASVHDQPTSPGHGLIGLRERVAVYGGFLSAGPCTGGGFRIAARVPLTEGEQV